MARILYGVHGTGHGHAMRALTIARRLRSHEFLFVAADDAPGVLEGEFPVRRVPNLGTVFKNYRVDLAATIGRAIPPRRCHPVASGTRSGRSFGLTLSPERFGCVLYQTDPGPVTSLNTLPCAGIR